MWFLKLKWLDEAQTVRKNNSKIQTNGVFPVHCRLPLSATVVPFALYKEHFLLKNHSIEYFL